MSHEDDELIEWVKSLHPETDTSSGSNPDMGTQVPTGGGFHVDGIDYSPDGIRAVRNEVIGIRDSSIGQWPEAIPFTLLFTHVIALLENYAELTEAAGEYIQAVEKVTERHADGRVGESDQG